MTDRTPIRTCVACRTRRPQEELVRLVRGPGGVVLDLRGGSPGRGAYVCPEPSCVASAAERGGRAVRRALRGGGEAEVLEALDAVPIRDGQATRALRGVRAAPADSSHEGQSD